MDGRRAGERRAFTCTGEGLVGREQQGEKMHQSSEGDGVRPVLLSGAHCYGNSVNLFMRGVFSTYLPVKAPTSPYYFSTIGLEIRFQTPGLSGAHLNCSRPDSIKQPDLIVHVKMATADTVPEKLRIPGASRQTAAWASRRQGYWD